MLFSFHSHPIPPPAAAAPASAWDTAPYCALHRPRIKSGVTVKWGASTAHKSSAAPVPLRALRETRGSEPAVGAPARCHCELGEAIQSRRLWIAASLRSSQW